MKTLVLITVFNLVAILFTPFASASYYYDKGDIQQRVIEEAKRQNVAPSLALAIAKVESNFNAQALSHAGAKGVMQIMPRTAEQAFGVHRNQLFDPDVNIELGVKFIKKLLKRYDGRLDIALSHYNGGSAVKNRHDELSVIPATRGYVDKVLATQQDFLQHDNQPLFASRFNQSDIVYIDNTEQFKTDSQAPDANTLAPQIETLRALRLHNITRNYKGKKVLSASNQPKHFKKSPSAQADRETKLEKVRQWESIYPD